MSAWYVWSALGLFPEIPGTADLAIGSPLFPAAAVSVGGSGGTLTVDARAAADAAPYVQGLTVNGTGSSLAYLPAADLVSSTTLDFSLGSSADTSWGAAAAHAPPSYGGTPGLALSKRLVRSPRRRPASAWTTAVRAPARSPGRWFRTTRCRW
jgi:putative alpha-1,2-mannosidase